MRGLRSALALFVLLLVGVGVSSAADRHWQTGTWADTGLKRDVWIHGGTQQSRPLGPSPGSALVPPEVGTYVIDTPDWRFELEDTLPIGGAKSFDLTVTVGASVTFAVNKTVAYIRNADGTEHQLRITKKNSRAKR